MSLRSWAIRGLILSGVAAVVALAWVANSWISPEHVRAQVIEHLRAQFKDVDPSRAVEVEVGSARMRLLGGIAVSDLKLTRKGATIPFLSVPSVVLYHDKEQLNRGQLTIKKIVLENPELNLERAADGSWNFDGLFGKGPADKPVPTYVVEGGTVHIVDRGPDPLLPAITLNDLQFTLQNEPIPVLAIQAHAMAKGFGPLIARARLNRVTGVLLVGLELSEFPLGEVLARNSDRIAPGLGRNFAGLAATASITADLTTNINDAKADAKWHHDIWVKLKDARFTNPGLPWPVENITAAVHIVDGRFEIKDASAQVAGAGIRLSLESREERRATVAASQQPDDILRQLEDRLAKLDLSIDGLMLDDVLFRALPARAQRVRQQFSPVGQVDLSYRFSRDKADWRRELELRPKQIAMSYEKFQYPVTEVSGWVKRTVTETGEPIMAIELVGTAAAQKVTIKGQIVGDGDDPGINLRIVGANIPIDEQLCAAFPHKYAEMVKRFHAAGHGDFVAEVVQASGVNLCENEFRIDIRDATLCHGEFPYPLEKVKGQLIVRVAATDPTRPLHPGETLGVCPDRDEIILHGFTAVHAGASIVLSGSRRPIPESADKKLELHVEASNCPVDEALRATSAAFKIDSIWTTFQPRGKLSFKTDVELIDRAASPQRPDVDPPLNPATDLKMKFAFSGATITPTFFSYELSELAGALEYKEGRVTLDKFTARHGDSRLKLARGETIFCPDGVVYADLHDLEMKPLIADKQFLDAMPAKLGKGLADFKLSGRSELLVHQLTVLTPPDAPLPPKPNGHPAPVVPISQSLYQVQPASPLDLASNALAERQRPTFASVLPAGPIARAQSPAPLIPMTQPDPVVYWDLQLKLLGGSLDTGVPWDQVFGSIACRGRYEGTHTGQVLGNIWIDSTSISGQPVTRISGNFAAPEQKPDPARSGEYLPTELEFTRLSGELFHGRLGGAAHVALTSPVRFNLWLMANDVQLEEVANHYNKNSKLGDADLKGIAQAQLRLDNSPDPVTGQMIVNGWGSVDVPTGRMYNLPILLDLVKLFKFETPNKTAFEEAHAIFRIQGDRVKVDQIDLIGRAVCLGGSGELDTSGNYVKFSFYTIISQVLARLINSPVGDLTKFLSQNLFVSRLTRENGELKYKPEAVPLVTDPALAVADRLRVRFAKLFGNK
jgi:hypothetical protein